MKRAKNGHSRASCASRHLGFLPGGNPDWRTHAFSLATTLSVAYILCAIFDALFPPFGLIRWLSQASPWPIYGSPAGFITGFVTFTAAGFVLGAIHGIAWGFWSKRLK